MMFECRRAFQQGGSCIQDGDDVTEILSAVFRSSAALNRYAPDSVHSELLQRWAVSTTLLRFYNSPAPCIPIDQTAHAKDSDSQAPFSEVIESSRAEGVESDGDAETTTVQKLQPFVLTR